MNDIGRSGDLPPDELLKKIAESSSDKPAETVLKTNRRVLSRVTDGIYRRPGSAIRELLSNSYDADATEVIIKTDRPRFGHITVEDNGIGMSREALVHLIYNIGGSAKRSSKGIELGLTDSKNSTLSPGGRHLIGNIGIGLFSVAQLTRRFQIITKRAGDLFRTVAVVILNQYSDEGLTSDEKISSMTDNEFSEEYEAGVVHIWNEKAVDSDSQGTTIVLTDIRPQTKETLQSRDLWAAIDSEYEESELSRQKPPAFHIGRVDPANSGLLVGKDNAFESLPWDPNDSPLTSFNLLVTAIWDKIDYGTPNPQLIKVADYYLQMVWELSLAIPAPYVEKSPFDLPLNDNFYFYELPVALNEPPELISYNATKTLRSSRLMGDAAQAGIDFGVQIDDLRLARPLRFVDLPTTNHAVRKPILFFGKCSERFKGFSSRLSGGPLEFEAYLMWAPKIAPTEHQGVLIRIHGSSGMLFDPTFMHYQVSEQTRLRQISCEIFVSKGLEGALNIDRESFNYAHPHAVYIKKWLHAALRRLATVQKKIAADIRKSSREIAVAEEQKALSDVVTKAWQEETDDPGAKPPSVAFDRSPNQSSTSEPGAYRFRHDIVLGKGGRYHSQRSDSIEQRLRAIVQLLAAFGLLEDLSERQQERLLIGIREIIQDQ